MNNEIILFESQDVWLEANMKDGVFVIISSMAKLFDRDKSVITTIAKMLYKRN